jgi:hypothetical protein
VSARTGPQTALRERYELIRGHHAARQLRECVDYLENPEVFVAEFVDSYHAMERFAKSGRRMPRGSSSDLIGAAKVIESLAGEERILVPERGTYAFRLVSPEQDPPKHPPLIDYTALTLDDSPAPILGGVAAPPGSSPYLTLLRLLIGLSEVAPPPSLETTAMDLFGTALTTPAAFDLHLVLQSSVHEQCIQPLLQLTRDLADVFHTHVADEWQFPNPLRQISCLELDIEDFGGSLALAWSV